MINRNGWGYSYSIVRGEILGFVVCFPKWHVINILSRSAETLLVYLATCDHRRGRLASNTSNVNRYSNVSLRKLDGTSGSDRERSSRVPNGVTVYRPSARPIVRGSVHLFHLVSWPGCNNFSLLADASLRDTATESSMLLRVYTLYVSIPDFQRPSL